MIRITRGADCTGARVCAETLRKSSIPFDIRVLRSAESYPQSQIPAIRDRPGMETEMEKDIDASEANETR
jgi:hypothetical protein